MGGSKSVDFPSRFYTKMTTTNIYHEKQTDEETYQMLKKNKGKGGLMNADEWKKLRIIELNKEGKKWTK